MLIEVKGISGLPKESGSLQVTKYIAPRMRQWDRTDIQGLSIINPQRNLPGLDRTNDNVFQEDVLTNAEDQQFGLLTAWDLFRLVRGFLRHGWSPEQVRPLLYRTGRIEPVPTHYEYLGVIDGFWEQAGAVGVRIEHGELEQGDRLAWELPVDFEEGDAVSLHVDGQPVEKSSAGVHVGARTALTKEQARKGTRVFRVASSAPKQASG